MAKPTQEIEISGHQLRLTALGPKRGNATLVRLMNVAGPVLEALFASEGVVRNKAGELDMSMAAMAKAAAALMTRVDEITLAYLVATFEETTEIMKENGYVRLEKLPLVREELWAADYGGQMMWLGAHIKLNYASFLAGAAAIVRQD